MKYAEVAVDAPLAHNHTLSYSIPLGMHLEPGSVVWAPILSRPVQGVVFGIQDRPQVEITKDILWAIGPAPLVSPKRLDLARWISRWYRSSLFDAVALMLPLGYKVRVRPILHLELGAEQEVAELSPATAQLLTGTEGPKGLLERDLERVLGKDGRRMISKLVRRGLLRRSWDLPHLRASLQYDCFLRLATLTTVVEDVVDKRARMQRALLIAVSDPGVRLPLGRAKKEYGRGAVDSLMHRGVIALEWVRSELLPDLGIGYGGDRVDTLTEAQESAIRQVTDALVGMPGSPDSFLLHGVTGSGKTEVYLRALEDCVKNGKQGIFLVPEIALTPQVVHRLNAHFPGRVAVMHSGVSRKVIADQWWRIMDGDYDVVVGPRSAIFAPVPDPGLIVIDEEHEWTYKQEDPAPRYDAREVALQMARRGGPVVLMGSATPDVVTYHGAQQRSHRLLELPYRVPVANVVGARAQLPSIHVCDMRQELREGHTSIFSRALSKALSECVDRGEQAILFVNRRGSASVVQCRDCGLVLHCRNCAVPLTYHSADGRLLCHQCGRRYQRTGMCRRCRSPEIRYSGIGTQRVMEEVSKLLPGVSTARWDSDAATSSEAHGRIAEGFRSGKTQVLVGTQMVAKGLHVPSVSVVGVVLADVGLSLPDFRAGERGFQLLSQVSGRAGRGVVPGEVIIQTFDPNHYAIIAAAEQDYARFYINETTYRRKQRHPPFSKLIHMVYRHLNAGACQQGAQRMGKILRRTCSMFGLFDVDVIGPAPAFPERIRGRYRWHVILRGREAHLLLDKVDIPQGWTVDVDPVNVL
jgi:primosomal protein N' (replication factor Y)